MNSKLAQICVLVAMIALVGPAAADEKDDLENLRNTTVNLLKLLVREGVLTQDKADALIAEAQKKTAPASAAAAKTGDPAAKDAPKPVVRVPYVPETVKREIREEIKQEVLAQAKAERWGDPGAVPEWLDRIVIDGDLRLRSQRDRFQNDNAPAAFFQAGGVNINNTTEDRERFRLRGRIGLQAKVADWMTAGMRVTTGTTDPVSTNQTLGNTSNKYQLVLDLAYLKLDPTDWLTMSGGRIINPWFSTDLMWNESLTFEGVAATVKPEITRNLRGFLTAGAFPLQDIDPAPTTRISSKWMFGAQAGFDWISPAQSRVKFGAALYEFRRIEGIPNSFNSNLYDLTAPQFRQKGNTVFNIDNDGNPATNLFALASKFRNLNVTGLVNIASFDPVHVTFLGEYAKNIGFDRGEILRRTGFDLDPQTSAYMGRLQVGMPQLRNRGDWQAFYGYKYIERDSVPDAFNDSDFHLGGTNAKGYFIGASYGLARNAWLTARWMSATEITGAPLAIDVFQLDLNARF